MRSVVIVIVLPLAKLVIEQVDVVLDAALVEQLVKLLVIHTVRESLPLFPFKWGIRGRI